MKLIDMDVGLAVKYLAGTANKQEKKKIEIWLNKSAENLKQFEDLKETGNLSIRHTKIISPIRNWPGIK